MRINVGIDIAKEVHWVTAIDADGVIHLDRKLFNTPADIAALVEELAGLPLGVWVQPECLSHRGRPSVLQGKPKWPNLRLRHRLSGECRTTAFGGGSSTRTGAGKQSKAD